MQVWVLAYYNTSDETDNGVLGVYATEQLARDAAIVEAKKDPNLERFKVKWKNEDTLIYGPDSGRWYEVRPYYYVTPWDVQGDPNGTEPTR